MKRIIALLLVLAMALLAGCSTSQTQAPAGDTAADTTDTADAAGAAQRRLLPSGGICMNKYTTFFSPRIFQLS